MRPTPRYQQLAETIHKDITEGIYQPGDQIPAINDLAAKGHTMGVAAAALQHLKNRGIIEARRGLGHYVPLSPISKPEEAYGGTIWQQWVTDQLLALGATPLSSGEALS